jgi:hypothetical protein
MKTIRTYSDAMSAMQSREIVTMTPAYPVGSKPVIGTVNGVDCEDGSGRCWNIRIQPTSGPARILFLREPTISADALRSLDAE